MTAVIKVEVAIISRPLFALFCFVFFFFSDNKKKIYIERTKLLFPGSQCVSDNNDVVSLLSIAILFLVIAFSQIN